MSTRRALTGNRRGSNPIPQDNLVAEYKLEETSGTVVSSNTGTNHGTHNNAALVTAAGKVGNAFNFTSTYYPVLVPYSTDFIFRDVTGNLPFSMCFWHKSTIPSSLKIFARWYLSSTNTLEFAVGNNVLQLLVWNQDGTTVRYELTTALDYPNNVLNTWYHLGVVFDPSATPKCKIFVDGQSKPIITTGTLSNIRTQNHTLRLGGLQREGAMDEIKIYKKALSNEQMLSIYNAEL